MLSWVTLGARSTATADSLPAVLAHKQSHAIILLNPHQREMPIVRIISGNAQKNRVQWLHDQFADQLPQEGECACTWEEAQQLDPTRNKKYLDWVLRLITKEKLPAEDHYKVSTALKEFIRCHPMLRRDGHSLDINAYESLQELFRVLQPYEMEVSQAQLSKAERAEVDAQTEVIIDSEELLVVAPKTEKASCFWGRGTKWCTAATDAENAFTQYTDANGNGLFIFIDKKRPGVKYQLSSDGALADALDFSLPTYDREANRLFSLTKGTHEQLDLAFVRFDRKLISQLNQTEEFCKKALSQDGLTLAFVKSPSEEMVELAVKTTPTALLFVKRQNKDLCLNAVSKNGLALQFVDFSDQMDWSDSETNELCRRAVETDPMSLKYARIQTESLCIEAVRRNGLALQNVKKQTHEICLQAVRSQGDALMFVNEQTKRICMEAVRKLGMSIRYVRDPDPEVDLAAVQREGLAIQFIPPARQKPAIKEAAIRNNPASLVYIKEPSEKIQLLAIKLMPQAILYVKNPSREMIDLALSKDGRCIRVIRNPSEQDCLTAIRQNPEVIADIPNPTQEMCLEAVRLAGHTIGHIKNQNRDLCLEAVKQDLHALLHIREQTEEICLAAVTHHPSSLQFVRNQTDKITEAAQRASQRRPISERKNLADNTI